MFPKLARYALTPVLRSQRAPSGCPLPMMVPRFRLRLFNELLPPRWRHMAGAATFGTGRAPERQAALNIAFALTDRAFS